MRIRWLTRIVAAAFTLLLGLLAGVTSAQAAYNNFYGVNLQGLNLLSSSALSTDMSAMSTNGLQVIRRDASWQTAEPTAPVNGVHSYNWSSFDSQVTNYAQHGLRWLPIIDYSTTWSGSIPGDIFSPPAHTQDFTAYATALARRYGRGGSFWSAHPSLPQLPVTEYEVWNEEDYQGFWHPQTDAPERYADLYMATRSALHAVDPNGKVMLGGLAIPGGILPTDFVDRMYQHRPDLRGNVDSIGYHPYMWTIDGVLERIREFRQLLDSVQAGPVPMNISEIGWPVRTSSEESYRASSLALLADQLPRSDCNVEGLIPHTWVTSERNASDNEDWFGIENLDGTPKPSSTAYLSTASRLRHSQSEPVARICHPPAGSATALGASLARVSGPMLRLRVVRRGVRRRRLLVYSRCPSGCRLRLRVWSRSGNGLHGRLLARRSLRFSSRRRLVKFLVGRRLRSVELDALALDRRGHATSRTRVLRMRALHR